MRRSRTAALVGAVAVTAVLAGGALSQAAGPPGPYELQRTPELPPVSDATGLPGSRLVEADPVDLPAEDPDGTARLTVTSGGLERPYLLAPARRSAPRSRPALLIVLPAANSNLRTEYDRYAYDALRDHGVTVLVAGTYGASWNAGSCCGKPVRDRVDDVAAVTAMRDDAVRRAGVDPSRVAVVGHSVGAMMAWRLACTPRFGAAAAIAVSGTLVAPCSGLSRTPDVLVLNGDADRTVPIDGSARVVPVLGIAPPSVRTSATRLAAAGACGGSTTSRVEDTAVRQWARCSGGGSVRFQVVQGLGHPWADLRATRRAAAFLDREVAGVS